MDQIETDWRDSYHLLVLFILKAAKVSSGVNIVKVLGIGERAGGA